MERALAARQRIRMPRFEDKAAAAILQANAGIRYDDTGAETHKVGLNKGDHHAAGIGSRQIDRAALRRRTVDKIRGFIGINQRCA